MGCSALSALGTLLATLGRTSMSTATLLMSGMGASSRRIHSSISPLSLSSEESRMVDSSPEALQSAGTSSPPSTR